MTQIEQPPVRIDRTTRFWDRIADRYAKKPVADEAAYQEKLRIARIFLSPEMEVMEFGCGTGSTALAQAPFVRHIHAYDISSKMIEICKRKATEAAITNVTFRQASLDDLDFPEGRFDAVFGHSVLHLLDDRDKAIAAVFRMLKPGGVFVSGTACLGDRMAFFKLIAPIGRALGLLPLLRVFTRQELLDSLTGAGFTLEDQTQRGKGVSVFVVARKPDAA
ncbi:methyltransferase domain-containing protein [Rhodobacteraceae bacterium NNCM2]|nr:methyltransferase domain-containing protein [Coraliihabitans acroporae]